MSAKNGREADFEIPEEMVRAGAMILLSDPLLQLGPSAAEHLAEGVIRAAIAASKNESPRAVTRDR
jgi:hypothetical protein